MPKTLVVYYSRTGTTRKVAEELAKTLKADQEEIIDTKDRSGPLGYLTAGRDAMKKSLTEISKTKKNPDAYDLVVVGTPVWGWTVCPAVRTYITNNKDNLKRVAFFCTMGGSGDVKTFAAMQEASGKKPVAVFSMKTKDVLKGDLKIQLKDYIKKLR